MSDELEVQPPQATQEDIDLLTEEPEVETEAKVEAEAEAEVSETEEIETKPEEKTEEKEEEIPPSRYPRPTLKDIRAKYPNFFKDFPEIKNAMFREQAYTDIFPTVEDAQEARESYSILDNIQQDLLGGDPTRIFAALQNTDKTAARRLVTNLLPSLHKVDQELYLATVTPVVQQFIRSMYADGKRSGNDNLANSALHALQFAGFEPEVLSGKSAIRQQEESPEIREQKEQLIRQQQQIQANQFSQVATAIENATKQELYDEVLNSVKDDKVSDYVKRSMVQQIAMELDRSLAQDEKHIGLMDSLWKRAERAGFTQEWAGKIRAAYISRAKALLPAIRSKVRAEALGQQAQPKQQVKAENTQPQKNIRGNVDKISPKQIDWRSTSDLDILEDRATLRRG